MAEVISVYCLNCRADRVLSFAQTTYPISWDLGVEGVCVVCGSTIQIAVRDKNADIQPVTESGSSSNVLINTQVAMAGGDVEAYQDSLRNAGSGEDQHDCQGGQARAGQDLSQTGIGDDDIVVEEDSGSHAEALDLHGDHNLDPEG